MRETEKKKRETKTGRVAQCTMFIQAIIYTGVGRVYSNNIAFRVYRVASLGTSSERIATGAFHFYYQLMRELGKLYLIVVVIEV